MTVTQLIELLAEAAEINPDMEVRIATQPSWPFEHAVGYGSAIVELDSEEDAVFYIAEGNQIGYLPEAATEVFQ